MKQDQGLHLSVRICALQQLQGQHQAGKETIKIIPVPDRDGKAGRQLSQELVESIGLSGCVQHCEFSMLYFTS